MLFRILKIFTISSLVGAVLGASGATFNLSRTQVSNDYSGTLSFQMTGLSPGESVQVSQTYDLNHSGALDAADLTVRTETIVDGDARLFQGSITNINLMRDEDGVANGAIAASLKFAFGPNFSRAVGTHFFRFTSPSNHFAPATVAFTVSSAGHAQVVQGAVKSNGTNIPNALVAVLQQSAEGIRVLVGGSADASGNYSLQVPVGTYQAMAFKAGYVGDLHAAPQLLVASNSTTVTNLNLIAATTTIAGKIVDSLNPAQTVLGSAELAFFSTNHLFTLGFADASGNFSVPVTANDWMVRVSPFSALAQASLVYIPGVEQLFHAGAGAVNNASIPVKRGTALLKGSVRDNYGSPIAGLSLQANADGIFNAYALTDTNGAFSMAIDAGGGYLYVNDPNDPAGTAHLFSGSYLDINDGEALSLTLTGRVVTARFKAQVTDELGTALAGMFFYAYNGSSQSMGETDANGWLNLPVFGGSWNIYSSPGPGVLLPDLTPFTITDGIDLTNHITGRRVTAQISGALRDSTNGALGNILILAQTGSGSSNFTATAYTDAAGHYSLGVFSGTWTVQPNDYSLEISYYPINATNITVPPNGIANFTAIPIPPPQITTTSLPAGMVGVGYGQVITATNLGWSASWTVSAGSLPPGLKMDDYSGYIYGTPTTAGHFVFTASVQDTRSISASAEISMDIEAAPLGPLQIVTTYLSDLVVGCTYSNQIQAQGGKPPFMWSLAAGSDPLPAALTLSPDGTLTGSPATSTYTSVKIQVVDSDGTTTNADLWLYVNPAMAAFPTVAPSGTLGVSYYGDLYVSGGGSHQHWMMVSNSLPAGLSLDEMTGALSGTPTNLGKFSFTARVTDGCSTLDVPGEISIYPPLTATSASLPKGSLNVQYQAQLQANGGVPPYSWSLNYTSELLPPGLSLSVDGQISGIPLAAGTSHLALNVYDSDGRSAALAVSLEIGESVTTMGNAGKAGPSEFGFDIHGQTGKSYTIQYATELLTNWMDLQTLTAPANSFHFSDDHATNNSRVYRVLENP